MLSTVYSADGTTNQPERTRSFPEKMCQFEFERGKKKQTKSRYIERGEWQENEKGRTSVDDGVRHALET
jgi:hypothetical protein